MNCEQPRLACGRVSRYPGVGAAMKADQSAAIAMRQSMVVPESLVAAVSNRDKVAGAPHDFYRYPARFSPVFAREAIRTFTDPGDFVLDPFCGGGTTLVEALSLGRRVAGMDVSSLAAFLARTKTTPISIHDKREIAVWLTALERKIRDQISKLTRPLTPSLITTSATFPTKRAPFSSGFLNA